MSHTHMEEIEGVLLLIAEARERAERAGRSIEGDGGADHLVQALALAERELHGAHLGLMRSAYFGARGSEQLRLAG